MIKKIVSILMFCLCVPVICFAGQLITGATVIEVANTSYNSPDFAVIVEGGIPTPNNCEQGGRIIFTFPEAKKQSDESYKQAFTIALTALSTGKTVRIHNFEDDSCSGANFISISK